MLTRREIEVFSFARSCTLSNLYLVNDLSALWSLPCPHRHFHRYTPWHPQKWSLLFFPVACIINGFFQRTGALGGLRPVLHIVDGTLQAVDGEDTGICHLPFLFHQTPGLFGNPEHLLYAGFPCHPGAIGNMGKLVGIVAKSRNLSKKFCMMLTGLCLKLCA